MSFSLKFLKALYRFFSRTSEAALPIENPLLAVAKSILIEGGVPERQVAQPRRYAISCGTHCGSRYCAMTLENYESYVVDLEQHRFAHYPTAGVDGFREESLVLSPDEKRFSLEAMGYDSFEVDLKSDEVSWQRYLQDSSPGAVSV